MSNLEVLIRHEYNKLLEGPADDIRSTLKSAGYTEKRKQLDDAGEMNRTAAKLFTQFFEYLKAEYPDVKIKVTAGHDKFHLPYNSKHNTGNAIDFTAPSGDQEDVRTALRDFKKENPNFKYLDEYKYPSPHSTGGHFHIALRPGEAIKGTNGADGDAKTDLANPDLARKYGEQPILSAEDALKKYGKKWKTPEAFKILWDYGAIPHELISNLFWLKIPTTYGDLLKFQDDDEVYSYQTGVTTTFTVDFSLQEQTLSATPGSLLEKAPKLYTKDTEKSTPTSGPRAIFINQETPKGDEKVEVVPAEYGKISIPALEMIDTAEKKSWVDIIQTILDWAGLIPGYGDLIDIVNATWYFMRGKYLEGTLTAIAAIPFVGSVFSLGAKAALRTYGATGKVFLNKIGTTLSGANKIIVIKHWTELLLNIKMLSPAKLELVSKAIPKIQLRILKLTKNIDNFPGTGSQKQLLKRNLLKMLKALKVQLKATEKAIRLKKLSKTAKGVTKVDPNNTILGVVHNTFKTESAHIRNAILKKFRKIFKWDYKATAVTLQKSLRNSFSTAIKPGSKLLGSAIGSSTKIRKMYGKGLSDAIMKKYKGKPPAELKKIYDGLNPSLKVVDFNPRAIHDAIDVLTRNGKFADELAEMSAKVADEFPKTAVGKQAFLSWKKKIMNDWGHLRAFTNPEIMATLGKQNKHVLNRLPLWWNEIEDVFEQIGVFKVGEEDNRQSVIMAWLIPLMAEIADLDVPYVSKGMKTIGTGISGGLKMADSAVSNTWLHSAAGVLRTAGVPLPQQKAFFNQAWDNSYPGETDTSKVFQILRTAKDEAEAKVLIDTFSDAITTGAADERLDLDKDDLEDIYQKYIEYTSTETGQIRPEFGPEDQPEKETDDQ